MPSKQASQQGMEVLQAQLEQMVGMLSEAETKRDELQAHAIIFFAKLYTDTSVFFVLPRLH